MRRNLQLAAVLVLLLGVLTPLVEFFDHWDRNTGPANDTELRLSGWLIGVGMGLTLGRLLRRKPARPRKRPQHSPQAHAVLFSDCAAGDSPWPTASPPLVPLRI